MSDVPTTFRPYARMGWGGRAASHWRGRATPADWRGPNGTVVYRSPGAFANFTLAGVTRDSGGTPLGNCSVELFITGSDQLLYRTVSDGSGNFSFSNPGTGPFYIVAYKAGSPDVAGTTVNTLVAS